MNMSLDTLDSNACQFVATTTKINPAAVLKVLTLSVQEGCTIPFISRYRKEATGGLDEVQVTSIIENYNQYLEREKRRAYILETIEEMKKLTPELKKKILAAETLNQLEDLYAPYKSKKKTKAQLAMDAGLGPLSEIIKTSTDSLEKIVEAELSNFINKEAGYENEEKVLEGIKAIIAEEIAHDSELKEKLRKDYWQVATLKSEKKKDADEIKETPKFKDYFEFEQKISELKNPKVAHRFLAIRRGMLLKVLKITIGYDEEQALASISNHFYPDLEKLGCKDFISTCIRRAYTAAIHTSLDLEIKGDLKLTSDESAIDVFGINLRNLLLQPYLGSKAVLGIDPGVRTGCKVAAIDQNGNFLVDTVIYPHEPKNDIAGSKRAIEAAIEALKIQYIAIGNGTYGRETLAFLKEHVTPVKKGLVKAMLVNEDGASIYSASDIARKEFPDKDLTVRGAISIARRFQDPLGELVKIDPKSIGVGQYQHDVNQAKLKKSLTHVVESCVNYVGVDLNTASAPLLSYISGIGPTVAENIVKHREKIKGFKNRAELLEVGRFSQKVFEQSAGFLRIYNGANPLDGTFIHPERYKILEDWCKKNKIKINDLIGNKDMVAKLQSDNTLINEIGNFTMEDIAKSLLAPNQDPRTEFQSFEYRDDISTINDLKVGQYYPGIVTNITQFGAFVDIGIKENGLIHVSQIADKFVENALEVLKVGEEVKARVIEVDLDRKRIALSLKKEGASDARSSAPRKSQPERKAKSSPSRNQRGGQQVMKNNAFASLKNFKVDK
jgi:uncharacterized protein